MRICCTYLLRWLLALHLGIGLAFAADPSIPGDAQADLQNQIQAASASLDQVHQSLDDADAPETLQTLSEKALKAKRDADDAVAALEPMLRQIDARIAQLGPLAPGSDEGSDIQQQRKELDQQHNDLDSAIKRGKLLSVEAAQTSDSIEKMRTQQFNAQITSKAASPLSPSLWQQFARQLPSDLLRIQALARQGRAGLDAAVARNGWSTPLWGLALALALLFPLRMGLRHLGRRYAASDNAPDGRLRRTGLAVWLLAVGTLLPGLAALVLVESLRSVDAIAPRLQSVADAFVKASFVAAFFLSISACLLVPRRPSWRLLGIDDLAAPALMRYAWSAAALAWFAMLLNAIDVAARTSAVSTVALDGLIALTYVGLIMASLATLNQQRHRAQGTQKGNTGGDGASPPEAGHPVQRSGWLTLAWLGGHLTVLTAWVATLLGYLNFSVFVTTQLVWMTVVVLATSLLMKFADDFFLWFFSPDSRTGRGFQLATRLSTARVEQIGVLLSALVRICLLLLGAAGLTATFGNSSVLLGWFDTLSNGLTVGGAVLKPIAVARAVIALIAGLTIFRTLQHWLVETYLPKTELDIGARNSISTVARYVGIILSALWTLAALGLGFEKLALLASALSVGIGFGLQAITQNFVSGLILLAERPVKLGDRVRIGDMEGNINRISVRATEIQTDDKATLIVPNSELITKAVRNITMDNALGRIAMPFAVPLSTDIVGLRQLVLEIYAQHEAVLQDPAPSMYVDSLSGGIINITSFGYVSSPRNVYSTRSDLLFALLQRTAEQDIALVTPTDIRVIQAEPPAQARNPSAPA
jgi:small-conductance mechanosensitive channel